jgi:hypothetical protein
VLCALGVEHDAAGVIFGKQGVEGADFLDEIAIAWGALIGNDDAVKRFLFGASTGKRSVTHERMSSKP